MLLRRIRWAQYKDMVMNWNPLTFCLPPELTYSSSDSDLYHSSLVHFDPVTVTLIERAGKNSSSRKAALQRNSKRCRGRLKVSHADTYQVTSETDNLVLVWFGVATHTVTLMSKQDKLLAIKIKRKKYSLADRASAMWDSERGYPRRFSSTEIPPTATVEAYFLPS